MIINGHQIQVYKKTSGRSRYWVTINQRAMLQRGKTGIRTFVTAAAAWTAAVQKAKSSPPAAAPRNMTGYSNPGGGGPCAPMGMPLGSGRAR